MVTHGAASTEAGTAPGFVLEGEDGNTRSST